MAANTTAFAFPPEYLRAKLAWIEDNLARATDVDERLRWERWADAVRTHLPRPS